MAWKGRKWRWKEEGRRRGRRIRWGRKEEERRREEELALEPNEEILQNPARITFSQLQYIDTSINADYEPVTDLSLGFIMLKNKE